MVATALLCALVSNCKWVLTSSKTSFSLWFQLLAWLFDFELETCKSAQLPSTTQSKHENKQGGGGTQCALVPAG